MYIRATRGDRYETLRLASEDDMQEDSKRGNKYAEAISARQNCPAWMVSTLEIERAIKTLSCEYGRIPSDSEIAQQLHVDLADHRLALHHREGRESDDSDSEETAQAELNQLEASARSVEPGRGSLFPSRFPNADHSRECLPEDAVSPGNSPEWIISAPTIERAIRSLSAEHGRAPTELEIATELRIDLTLYWETLSHLKDIEIGMLYAAREGADDEWMAYGGDGVEGDVLFRCLRSEMQALFRGAIRNLPTMERLVITLSYSEHLYDKSISVILELPESAVCNIRTSAILHLRASLPNPLLQVAPRVRGLLPGPDDGRTSRETPEQTQVPEPGGADVTVHGEQSGLLQRGQPWECLGEHASWKRDFRSWYLLDDEQKLIQIKRLEHYHLDLEL
jgi:DNA-directed RNA polymerase specialized sigma subunit